jgi:hypothetical protein
MRAVELPFLVKKPRKPAIFAKNPAFDTLWRERTGFAQECPALTRSDYAGW